MFSESYEATGNALRGRILALIPEHQEILYMDDCFELFKVEGFKCDDLQPSIAQADWAMRSAQRMYRDRHNQ